MADQEPKADEREDQDDTSGHSARSVIPDPDSELGKPQVRSSDDGKDDDTEGHISQK